ncbi:ABC transporter ATP-binding protein [Leucobacter sp. cx-328]|uniref:ABC transporter ATP-binding protein n=1 Tax=unclassified Leucobacter TaxID=2621730 RepID=UPI00165D8CEE|nr:MULTISPECIES: ABC transporter ATP-binding protein [unclassified Leucobacter]MBC9943130.1 ABC transporter ATP-binding protein [Leucobacter sp. cx-328]
MIPLDSVALSAASLSLGYAGEPIITNLDVSIPDHSFTVIIGPNGCGKSTLLKSLARMIRPLQGHVSLHGEDIAMVRPKALARRIGMLTQPPLAPAGLTVGDLVARGRNPHQTLLRQWSVSDEEAVSAALAEVNMTEHAHRFVDELSGGQRQRAWIAMALAQDTPVLLLDEPTTYLDVAHQLDVLDLCSQLHAGGRTLVAVLHDLNLAARYATHVIAMREGRIVATGSPTETITPELLHAVFDLEARVIPDPETGRPLVIPRDRRASALVTTPAGS